MSEFGVWLVTAIMGCFGVLIVLAVLIAFGGRDDD